MTVSKTNSDEVYSFIHGVNVDDVTPYSRTKENPAIQDYGKRQGFHTLQTTYGDPSDTGQWKTSMIPRLTTDRRRPQQYKAMENIEKFTPYRFLEFRQMSQNVDIMHIYIYICNTYNIRK
jgi:hypothetical protein